MRTRSSPTKLSWQWTFSSSSTVAARIVGNPDETADLYLLPNGTKLSYYHDHHNDENAYYSCHSTVPTVGDGRTYHFAINFTGACKPPSPQYRCTFVSYVRFNFKIIRP